MAWEGAARSFPFFVFWAGAEEWGGGENIDIIEIIDMFDMFAATLTPAFRLARGWGIRDDAGA
jgi:hypothetical protein